MSEGYRVDNTSELVRQRQPMTFSEVDLGRVGIAD